MTFKKKNSDKSCLILNTLRLWKQPLLWILHTSCLVKTTKSFFASVYVMLIKWANLPKYHDCEILQIYADANHCGPHNSDKRIIHSAWIYHRENQTYISIQMLFSMVLNHYGDVIMGTIASQITSLTIVYSTVYSGADQRKHQSSASLAFVRGIHRDRWIPCTKVQ